MLVLTLFDLRSFGFAVQHEILVDAVRSDNRRRIRSLNSKDRRSAINKRRLSYSLISYKWFGH